MSAYAQPAQSTSTPTVAPAAAASSQARKPAASNSDRQEDLGLVGEFMAAAADLTGLGPMVSVVLDALELDDAFELAWPIRQDASVRAWLCCLDVSSLIEQAPHAMACILDQVWKPGVGVELQGAGDLTLAFGELAAEASVRVVRGKNGFEVQVAGGRGLGAVCGLGSAVYGAEGVSVGGAAAGAQIGTKGSFVAQWLLGTDVVLGCAADAVWGGFVAGSGYKEIASAMTRTLASAKPESWSFANQAVASATATAGVYNGAAAKLNAQAGMTVGQVGNDEFVEIGLGMVHDSPHRIMFLERCGFDGEFEAAGAVRMTGDWQSFLAGDAARVRFYVRIAIDGQMDVIETRDLATLVRFLSGHARAEAGGAFRATPKEMTRAPDIALTRSVERRVSLDSISSLLGCSLATINHGVPDLASVEKDAILCGSVRVEAEAIAAAIGTGIRWNDVRTPEDMAVQIAEVVAAFAVGGVTPDVSALPAMNWSAARAWARVEDASLELRYCVKAGFGGGISDVAKLEGKATAAVTGIVRSDLPMRVVMEQRKKLFLLE